MLPYANWPVQLALKPDRQSQGSQQLRFAQVPNAALEDRVRVNEVHAEDGLWKPKATHHMRSVEQSPLPKHTDVTGRNVSAFLKIIFPLLAPPWDPHRLSEA